MAVKSSYAFTNMAWVIWVLFRGLSLYIYLGDGSSFFLPSVLVAHTISGSSRVSDGKHGSRGLYGPRRSVLLLCFAWKEWEGGDASFAYVVDQLGFLCALGESIYLWLLQIRRGLAAAKYLKNQKRFIH